MKREVNKMRVTKTIEIDIKDFIQGMRPGEAFYIIKQVDEYIANWDFTLDVLGYFLKLVYDAQKEILAENENCDIIIELPNGWLKKIKLKKIIDLLNEE